MSGHNRQTASAESQPSGNRRALLTRPGHADPWRVRSAMSTDRPRYRFVLLFLSLSLPLIGQAVGQEPAPGVSANAVEVGVEAFHAQLLKVMQMPGYADRLTALEPAVARFFDMPTVSRLTLGRFWRELEPVRRSQFHDLLENLIAATYADRFDSYDGQRFVTVGSVPARQGWVVKTELIRANGERVNLDYYFNGDAVFNVVADGVSDLSLRRADYNSIIKREGFGVLLRHLQDNIAELHGNNTGAVP